MPLIRFLESVNLIMIQSLTNLLQNNESKKPLKAALVIDNLDETAETDIK
jgi:hypothetical protein